MSDRGALLRALSPQPKRPAEPVFKERADDPWNYRDACAVVDARSNGACECGRGCGLRANVHHHVSGRGGANPHHPDNLLHLADQCHRWVHDHPEESYDLGLMRRRLR